MHFLLYNGDALRIQDLKPRAFQILVRHAYH